MTNELHGLVKQMETLNIVRLALLVTLAKLPTICQKGCFYLARVPKTFEKIGVKSMFLRATSKIGLNESEMQ
jgi:hypothetical protein